MLYPKKSHPKWTNEYLAELALQFKHRSQFKRAHKGPYDAAWRRELLDKICAHMEPMASPYGKDYEIYAYEFADRHAYVGLTFLPQQRDIQHKARTGRSVADYMKVCREYVRKVLQSGLTRKQAPSAEKYWIKQYRDIGWTLLNKNDGGSTGCMRGRKWTKETVVAEGQKYTTKQEWIDKSQMSYRIAKRNGWFEEASAHMPNRDARHLIGRKTSNTTKEKMRQAKLGITQTKEHRQRRSEAGKRWWASRRGLRIQ